jgi:hypothetical protein
MYLFASSLAAAKPAERRVSARRGWVGENNGLFEHPASREAWTFGDCMFLTPYPALLTLKNA